jgi:hypothetical protein
MLKTSKFLKMFLLVLTKIGCLRNLCPVFSSSRKIKNLGDFLKGQKY